MLAGDATSRVERVDGSSRAPRDAAADYLDSLPAADVRAIPAAESIPAAEIGEARAEGDAGAEAGPEEAARGDDGDQGASGQRDLQSRGASTLKRCMAMDKRDGSKSSYAESYADAGATGAKRESSQAAAVVDGARVDGGERA